MKKLFLAIRIPITNELEGIIKNLRRNFGFMEMHWIEPQYMHMTLKFFGPTSFKREKKIIDSLSLLFAETKAFEMSICKLAMFGSRGAPKVLWLGIEQEQELKDLVENIQTEIDKIYSYKDNQNFVPHISIGRIIKTNSNPTFQKQLKKFRDIDYPTFNVSNIVLLESIIGNNEVEYKEVNKFNLN